MHCSRDKVLTVSYSKYLFHQIRTIILCSLRKELDTVEKKTIYTDSHVQIHLYSILFTVHVFKDTFLGTVLLMSQSVLYAKSALEI